jgi:hypothetical protein
MRRRFKVLLLSAVTAISGVFIACAYGFRYWWDGVAQNKSTKAPIPGIKVACMIDGKVSTSDTTAQDGSFSIGSASSCQSFVFSDVDGAAHGSYATETVSLKEGQRNVVDLTAM